MVQVRVSVLGPNFPFTRLLLVDASGRARISLQTDLFSLSDLDTLETALAVPLSQIDDPVAPRALNRRYPGAAPFVLVHRFGAMFVVALLALMIVGFLVPAPSG